MKTLDPTLDRIPESAGEKATAAAAKIDSSLLPKSSLAFSSAISLTHDFAKEGYCEV